jgi:hydroxypyruvate isomerase
VVRTFGLRFDVNCSILFTELPLTARAGAAAACGFAGVEFWWPWDGMSPSDKEADAFVCSILEAGVDHVALDAVALGNLRLAARAASKVGASVLVEAINSVDVPGFPIDGSARAMAVIKRVGAGNAGFLADLYHLTKMGEDVADVLDRYRGSILHVQVADPPGRGAPGTGELDFEPVFAQLAAQGYDGWVGLEYVPGPAGTTDSAEAFGWLREAAGA